MLNADDYEDCNDDDDDGDDYGVGSILLYLLSRLVKDKG